MGTEAELGKPQLLEREINRYVSAMQNRDPVNTGVSVGEATGLIHDVRPAADLLPSMVGEAARYDGARLCWLTVKLVPAGDKTWIGGNAATYIEGSVGTQTAAWISLLAL